MSDWKTGRLRETEEYHWVRLAGETGDFEPGLVDYLDGRPVWVWFINNEWQFRPDQCEIAEQIIRAEK